MEDITFWRKPNTETFKTKKKILKNLKNVKNVKKIANKKNLSKISKKVPVKKTLSKIPVKKTLSKVPMKKRNSKKKHNKKKKKKSKTLKKMTIFCGLGPVTKENLKKPIGWHNLFEWILFLIPCLMKELANQSINAAYIMQPNPNKLEKEYDKKWFIRSCYEFCYIFITYFFTYSLFYYMYIKEGGVPYFIDWIEVQQSSVDDTLTNIQTMLPNELTKNIPFSGMLPNELTKNIPFSGTSSKLKSGSILQEILLYLIECLLILPNIFTFCTRNVLPLFFKFIFINQLNACFFLLLFVVLYIIVYFLLNKFSKMFLNIFLWKPDKSVILFIIIGWFSTFFHIDLAPKDLSISKIWKRVKVFSPISFVIESLFHLIISIALWGVATLIFLVFFFSILTGFPLIWNPGLSHVYHEVNKMIKTRNSSSPMNEKLITYVFEKSFLCVILMLFFFYKFLESGITLKLKELKGIFMVLNFLLFCFVGFFYNYYVSNENNSIQ